MKILHQLHSKSFAFAAFLISIALGGWACVQNRDAKIIEATHLEAAPPTVTASPDPAAQSVQAMPLYQQADKERALGHRARAKILFARLANSPTLNAAEQAYCRHIMQVSCEEVRR